MRICSNCGKKFEGNEKYCDQCGSPTEELKRFCENCGMEMPYEALFCNNCGTKASDPVQTEKVRSNEVSGAVAMQSIKSSLTRIFCSVASSFKNRFSSIQKITSNHKIPRFVVPAVAIVLVVSLLIGIVFGVKKIFTPNEYIFFYSGEKLMEYNCKDKSVKTIGNSSIEHDEEDSADVGWRYSRLNEVTKVSDTSDRIFYPNNYNSSDGSFFLYVKNTNKTNDSPVKVDSEVNSYDITSDGSKVIYTKGTDHILYVSSVKKDKMGERQKIASNVSSYYFNDDFTSFVWKTDDGIWYSKKGDNEKTKIVDDTVTDIQVYNTLDVYYLQDGTLYYQPFDKENNKVDSQVESFYASNFGNVYYIKGNNSPLTLYDYYEDDLYKKDSTIKEPVAPDYWDYINYSDYLRDYDKYQESYTLYYEKTIRDQIRESLKGEKDNTFGKTLYSYNGKKSERIDENVVYLAYLDSTMCRCVYYVCDINDIKVKFSGLWESYKEYYNSSNRNKDILNDYDLELFHNIKNNCQCRYAIENEKPVTFEGEYGIFQSEFGTKGKLYYLADSMYEINKVHPDDGFSLMTVNTNQKETTSNIYAEGVHSFSFFNRDHVYYATEYSSDSNRYTLSVDGKEVDSDVSKVCVVGDELYYFTDWNTESEYGTLKKYESNGKSTLIADDVHSFAKYGDKLIYLADYSSEAGDLYYFKNKTDKVLLAESVNAIFGENDGTPDYASF